MHLPHRPPLCLALAGLLAAGCTPRASVTGVVTFDGRKVEKGYVTFYPVGERGETRGATAETRGADIIGGAFTLDNLSPGKRKVVVSSPPTLVARQSGKHAEPAVKALPPDHPIPAGARGNGQIIDIHPGSQTLELALYKK